MLGRYYILDENGEPAPEPELLEWAAWMGKSDRRVAAENVGDAMISTVFLGTNHAWRPGPPVLWETMVFGGELNEEMDRCAGTREQAEAMHRQMVERVAAVQALRV